MKHYVTIYIDEYKVHGNLKDIFGLIKSLHSTFLKFQNIDDNLKSVKGAKAFMTWARTMMDNNYLFFYCLYPFLCFFIFYMDLNNE